jgi:flagellar biosynthetic protein FliR
LFIAFSVTLALTPILSSEIEKHLSGIAPAALTRLFISEMLIGALIGFLARIFFGALETLAGSLQCLSV